jgi:hypothetical protein
VSAREEQIRAALAQAEAERIYAIQRTEQLKAAYDTGWADVRAAMAMLEPIHLELIARRVRAHVPDATAIAIEATDQGGPGWVLTGAVERVVTLADGSKRDDIDDLHDDDELTVLLSDLGAFMSSLDHPAQDLQLPAKPEEDPDA